MLYALLALAGVAIGTLGTLIGAGGGFILMPILVFAMPSESAARLTAISMGVVFANALSGTIGYARRRRVDFRSGTIFAAASIPGALIGTWVTSSIHRGAFDLVLGGMLVVIAILLLIRGAPKRAPHTDALPPGARYPRVPQTPRDRVIGITISLGVGFLASLLGIGGGIIHVPLLVFVLHFPVHIAAATSHFVLFVTAAVATGVSALSGDLAPHLDITVALAAGALAGAQIGAALSHQVPAKVILRALAVAMILAGGRVIWRALAASTSHPPESPESATSPKAA